MATSTISPPAGLEEGIRRKIAEHRAEMALAHVRRVDVAFAEDSIGDPAVHLNMVVDRDLPPTQENIEDLDTFANLLVQEALSLSSDYWPYVHTVVE